MRRELKDERESADERLVKKMRLEKRPTFRKIGNKKQYKFNEEVQDKLDSADAALAQRPLVVEKARSLLQEGQKLIFVRQKKIRIADRSENGWATVKESEEDELAENSDDEKRLSIELKQGLGELKSRDRILRISVVEGRCSHLVEPLGFLSQ